MSMPDSPTRRRPVPPPKSESQARLREDLTALGRSSRAASNQRESIDRPQSDTLDAEVQKREAMKHLTLPPGWDLRNEVDVTYHTHVAKPVVHETIHQETTELVEPKITREYHRYHQYDYIQPLEAEIPNNSYATNADGGVIHAPGGLSTKKGQTSYWEQDRQDRGYSLPHTLEEGKDRGKTAGTEAGRDKTVGPFPIRAEGGGEHILQGIRDGGIARRFGGNLTSAASTTSHPNHTTAPGELPGPPSGGGFDDTATTQVPQTRPRGGGYDETSPLQKPNPPYAPRTPPRKDSFHSAHEDFSAPISNRNSNPNPTTGLEQHLNRLSLDQHPEAKPLPPLPDSSPRSPSSKSGVRRMSGDNKLRDKYSMDSSRASLEDQNPMIADEVVPERGSSARKTRIY